ncbi:MAG: peptide chain release factor N(5)-glutamine methyltransferase [Gammaproteobacteria bacterium]|jgi:release factor glutamine methyltransferase|nr:peptide chain release factor N(5)-glutamine methyltransferase [Gammaproteobacteria bacterium]
MSPPSIGAVLRAASDRLRTVTPTARLDAEVLLAHAAGQSRSWVLARGRDPLSEAVAQRFDELLARRIEGQPIAYLTGTREFWSREFHVTPAVLIPRPETEHLVEAVLERLDGDSPCRIADLGTGSGIIAVTLALERPAWQILGVDIDSAALTVARDNAVRLGANNASFLLGDWMSAIADGATFDCIVSNPPYIAADDPHLHSGDVRFEPAHALVAADNGMQALGRIAAQARTRLRPGGWLALEHGCEQGPATETMLRQAGYANIGQCRDLAGHVRVTLARRSEEGHP